MKLKHTTFGVVSVLCLLALIAMPVSAFGPPGRGDGQGGHRVMDPVNFIDHLEEQGIDISTIRTAIENRDNEAASSLIKQLMGEHREKAGRPFPDEETRGISEGHLDRFEMIGIDVSGIRTAIESGDNETASALMKQLMEEHRDEVTPRQDRSDAAIEASNATRGVWEDRGHGCMARNLTGSQKQA